MSPPFRELAELRALLDALCEESITAEQMRRLEELVLAHPEAEAYYVQYLSLHADLSRHFAVPPAVTEASLRDRARGTPARSRPRLLRYPRLLLGLSALAAGVLLAVVLWPRPRVRVTPEEASPEPTDNTVAVLLQANGAEWEGPGPVPQVGTPLPPGRLRLRAGLAHLEFYSGATVILEGPADLRLISPRSAYCLRGRLRATVPPQAQGFTIGTPDFDLVDRGTEFGVAVGPDERTEVHVFQGLVELHDPGRNPPAGAHQDLKTGQGVRRDGPGQVRSIRSDPAAFHTAQYLEGLVAEELRRRQEAWRAASQALRRDPSLLLYYTFQPEQPSSRTLHDQAPGGGHDGVIVGCRWGSGRWPGKAGLEFHQVSDRVRFHVPGEFDALTLLAWVRVDALPNRFNALMMTDGWDDGAPHWHMSPDGTLELGVQGPNRKGGVHYLTPPVLTAEWLGRWVQLAVVYDRAGGRVTHFLNGRPVEQEPTKLDTPLRLGNAEIGNWDIASYRNKSFVRYFSGCMDEFLVFARALSADEVERLADQGRPPS
jgi:hypothetical protein